MNEVLKAMKERRSIRAFQPTMPPKADLEQIIEAGLYAPSGKGEQAAIIIAVTNQDLRDKLAAANAKIAAGRRGSIPSMVRRSSLWCWAERTGSPTSTTAASSWATSCSPPILWA